MTPSLIHDLCERYERNRDSYRSDSYNEAQARQEFINPLFKLLGWDMDNEQGYAEAYKDVVHEDAIRIGGAIKAPDYSFRIGGQRKFFLEAKKPRVSVVDQKDPAYQLRRYAWSAKLPLSILTNFSELAVYDCRFRPEIGEAAGKHRVEYFTYEKYAEKWEYLVNTFSKDAINKGSFDKYAQTMKGKRGTQEVDSEFLKEIELWRDLLAKNLKLRNKDLSIEALNFSVGRIIDRIIFLRVCEDRGIEDYGQLEGLLKGTGVYESLVKLFKRADERYNSGLFHFQREKGRGEQPDTLTPGLAVDDKILKEVVRTLYYPQSPYEFRVFPADILGQVYEQFLGKVIVKSGKTVDVEEKPEVRKAGGVYYTPTYIVDYIVKHTVGKLVEGKTPDEVSKLRVLDPACGSGSFLIGAYQYLLDWHLSEYTRSGVYPPLPPQRTGGESESSQEARPSKRKTTPPNPPAQRGGGQKIYETAGGWRLTLAERKRILLNNIYGVDIDGQAVEVTKLSLLLKVLEGSNAAEVQGELSLRHHALPDLGENIKCGNSLVGPDILQNSKFKIANRKAEAPLNPPKSAADLGGDLSDEEIARINPFDWQAEFKDVFKQGGFDAVIGNPPYIHSRDGLFDEPLKEYMSGTYRVAQYQFNTYPLFIEAGMSVLRSGGRLGYIVPNYWLSTKYDSELRELLSEVGSTVELTNTYRVFDSATVDTLVVIVDTTRDRGSRSLTLRAINRHLLSIDERLRAIANSEWVMESQYPISRLTAPEPLSFGSTFSLKGSLTWADSISLSFGMKPYQVGKGKPAQTQEIVDKKPFNSDKKIGKDFHKLVTATQVKRYHILPKMNWIKYGAHLAEPRNIDLFSGPRLLIQRIVSGNKLFATFTDETLVCNTDVITLIQDKQSKNTISLHYVLGLLCSSLIGYVLRNTNVNLDRQAFPKINTNSLRQIPFPDKADKARHDKVVKLVERMLELNKKLPEVKVPGEREKMERQIAATDREIDLLVYELYGLTAEEIAVVEGKG